MSGKRLPAAARVVGIGLIAIYLAFVALQVRATGSAELEWTRRMQLLKGVEALAYAAAGTLFGTTVQRQVTRKVEEQKAEAEQAAAEHRLRANQNEAEAQRGRALVNLLAAKVEHAPAMPKDAIRGPGFSRDNELRELLEFARQYGTPDGPEGKA